MRWWWPSPTGNGARCCAPPACRRRLPAAAAALGCRLDDEAGRYAARGLISTALRPWFAARTLAEVAAAFSDRSLLWGPYRSFEQMLAEDPRCSEANPMFQPHRAPGRGTLPHRHLAAALRRPAAACARPGAEAGPAHAGGAAAAAGAGRRGTGPRCRRPAPSPPRRIEMNAYEDSLADCAQALARRRDAAAAVDGGIAHDIAPGRRRRKPRAATRAVARPRRGLGRDLRACAAADAGLGAALQSNAAPRRAGSAAAAGRLRRIPGAVVRRSADEPGRVLPCRNAGRRGHGARRLRRRCRGAPAARRRFRAGGTAAHRCAAERRRGHAPLR